MFNLSVKNSPPHLIENDRVRFKIKKTQTLILKQKVKTGAKNETKNKSYDYALALIKKS